MSNLLKLFAVIFTVTLFISCGRKDRLQEEAKHCNLPPVAERLNEFAPTDIKVDLSNLTERERTLIQKLCEAGHIADAIYWKQTAIDAIQVRDSLKALNTPEAKTMYDYVMLQYGPYDRIHDGLRFVGKGADKKPLVGTYYPQDMTKEEFEKYIKENPNQKEELESQYTVVVRDGNKLKAIPFHQAYPEVEQLAKKLEEAAEYADDPALKKYLILRAKALRTDEYFESDMAWMDVQNSNVDVVIGPIENYEDALFNYKTAFETVVMVKDIEATKQFEQMKSMVNDFSGNLPVDKKYLPTKITEKTEINFMNVVYFGGDCQKTVKTIAASLPNDPKVLEARGGKNSMYKNMMEAKFDKIVVPIANTILDKSLLQYVDKKAFVSFVTMHEISHTLGPKYILNDPKLSVRKALKEKYSAIEEAKADILGIYNQKLLFEKGIIDKEMLKKQIVTYVAGLYRSIRFGTEEAHGKSNVVQLNFLFENGAIVKQSDGKLNIAEDKFMEVAGKLATIVLTLEGEGNYDEVCKFLEKYGKVNEDTKNIINSLKSVPRDLNTKYEF